MKMKEMMGVIKNNFIFFLGQCFADIIWFMWLFTCFLMVMLNSLHGIISLSMNIGILGQLTSIICMLTCAYLLVKKMIENTKNFS